LKLDGQGGHGVAIVQSAAVGRTEVCNDAAVRSRRCWIAIAAALVALSVTPSVSSAASLRSTSPVAWPGPALPAADPPGPPVSASVGPTPAGKPIGPGYVGVSMEFSAVHAYTGRDPSHVNPVLVQLLRQLAPGQSPVIRIGGNSSDRSWWPIRGVIPPGGVAYTITRDWLETTHALAAALNAHLILGVNLAAGRPALAAAEARAYLGAIGRQYIDSIEVGNEPDVYGQFVWYRAPDGKVFFARTKSYSLSDYERDFAHWQAALPTVPLAGPALAETTWLNGLPSFLDRASHLSLVTVHRYPLRGCIHDPTSPLFASIPNLLADSSSSGLAQEVAPSVAVANTHGLPLRLDEINSVSCSGATRVSDTFASALWALDMLFNMASVGIDGVNFHTFPGARYALFSFSHSAGGWSAFVLPEYYGMLMFTQAAPPGAQLLPVSAPSGPLKVWATKTPSGQVHVVLINKSLTDSTSVSVSVPGASSASVEWMQAPSASSNSGVTIGGQSFGNRTTTGTLGPMQTGTLSALLGTYTIDVPPASAVMLTQ
jgi:hypothetical protein